jgi:hypothetical protein
LGGGYRAGYSFGGIMTLQILCITNGEPHAGEYIGRMFMLANRLGCELILGLDRERAQTAGYPCHNFIKLTADTLQENVVNEAVSFCTADYLLRLDDDEVVSPALENWLDGGIYEMIGNKVYAFPRVYMWGDEDHILTNPGMWPDLQTRLGKRECMLGVDYIHAGNRHGTGQIVPYAIEHHKFLVKTHEQRQAIADRYEAIRPGAGSRPEYARYNLPELFYPVFETKPYTDGDYSQ